MDVLGQWAQLRDYLLWEGPSGDMGGWGLAASPEWRTIVVTPLPTLKRRLGSSSRGLFSCVSLPHAALSGKKPGDPSISFYYFGRREATSVGMMAEAAFRVIFRDQLLHSNGILSRLSGGWSNCLAGQSSFGYWKQLPKP